LLIQLRECDSPIYTKTIGCRTLTVVPMEGTRVLLVDDHLVLTEALATLLCDDPELCVVGRSTSDDPCLSALVKRLQPDIITVEIAAQGSESGRLVERLLSAAPNSRVVVLTSSRDAQQAADVARAGATAWVSKQCSAQDFVTVLGGVCRGEAFFPAEVLGRVLGELRGDIGRGRRHDGPLDQLTAREREVLTGMVAGWSSARIAREFVLSEHTVRSHIRAILGKLDAHGRLEAVQKARAAGMSAGGGSGRAPTSEGAQFP
jgi:two-component system nitrate/nitrite response regulator NarL